MIESNESSARDRILREEGTLRLYITLQAEAGGHVVFQSLLHAITVGDEDGPVLAHDDESAISTASTPSLSSSSSFSGSAVFTAIANANESDLDAALDKLRTRHERNAEKIARYAGSNLHSVAGSNGTIRRLLQSEEEQRGDIEMVQRIWRANIEQRVPPDVTVVLNQTKIERLERSSRERMMTSEKDERRMYESDAARISSILRDDAFVRGFRTSHITQTVSGPSSDVSDTSRGLVAVGISRAEASARNALENMERTARQATVNLRIHVASTNANDPYGTLRAHLAQRKLVWGDRLRDYDDLSAMEWRERQRLTERYGFIIALSSR